MDHEARHGTAGAFLRQARQAQGWSLREVEARTGTSHGYVGSLEQGARLLVPEVARDLADLYNLPLVDLLLRGMLERARAVALRFLRPVAPRLCGAGYRVALLRPDGTTVCAQDLGTGELVVTPRPGELRCAPPDDTARQAS